jgi:hypothetical protein
MEQQRRKEKRDITCVFAVPAYVYPFSTNRSIVPISSDFFINTEYGAGTFKIIVLFYFILSYKVFL